MKGKPFTHDEVILFVRLCECLTDTLSLVQGMRLLGRMRGHRYMEVNLLEAKGFKEVVREAIKTAERVAQTRLSLAAQSRLEEPEEKLKQKGKDKDKEKNKEKEKTPDVKGKARADP